MDHRHYIKLQRHWNFAEDLVMLCREWDRTQKKVRNLNEKVRDSSRFVREDVHLRFFACS